MDKVKKRMMNIIEKKQIRTIAISFSGGKDSTVLLHLALELAKEKNLKLIILHSDTLVENPVIHEYVFNTFKQIEEFSRKEKVEIELKIAKPEINNTFWVNLIGKGYPLPYHLFRWCQDKLKIRPIKKILNQLKQEKIVVFVGLRKEESSDRSRSLGKRLETDFELKGNGVPTYAPMVDITEKEVWNFLINNSPPYGGSYRRVIEIYKEAKGECPLIPTQNKKNFKSGCGMRFGCWVCTLVREDKTLKNQILENPYLKPLYEFRQFMIETCSLPESRSGIRRSGQYIGKGKGVLKLSVRKLLLSNLINLQTKLGKQIITSQEIDLIKNFWRKDEDRFGKIIF